VTQALFGHVERRLRVEYTHVKREQAIHVLGQESDVMRAVDELHNRSPSKRFRPGRQGAAQYD
jgi:hypothetical protein